MIQSHYLQSSGRWLRMIKHWICASEVSLTETKSKGVENEAIDVEGEWDRSHIGSCEKGRRMQRNKQRMTCHATRTQSVTTLNLKLNVIIRI